MAAVKPCEVHLMGAFFRRSYLPMRLPHVTAAFKPAVRAQRDSEPFGPSQVSAGRRRVQEGAGGKGCPHMWRDASGTAVQGQLN